MYYLGYDIGSSFIKASLIDASNGACIDTTRLPEQEMAILSEQSGWAEQDPKTWWSYVCELTSQIKSKTGITSNQIKGIGIAYQMHGLVLVDHKQEPLRPAIIWCDSRAVEIGNKAFETMGAEKCTKHLLNSPGNFTLSKLKWVQENEPELYKKAYKLLLPGDFIALKMTGKFTTTASGLSEGIMWDFMEHEPATWLFEALELDSKLLPDIVPTFGNQGELSMEGANALGLEQGTPVLYRAGDQPNNALSLGVLNPGEIAATGGTSGVVYAITDKPSTKETLRINSFAHVNHTSDTIRIGKLLNINGAGISYSWLKKNLGADTLSYNEMNRAAEEVPIGSDGLCIIPFGNGAERILNNLDKGASVHYLNYNIHTSKHFMRATLEGIAFSFVYGMQLLEEDGVSFSLIKSGNDNLFQSEIVAKTIASLMNVEIQLIKSTGAYGAAVAAAYADGHFKTLQDAFAGAETVAIIRTENREMYERAYKKWKHLLETNYR